METIEKAEELAHTIREYTNARIDLIKFEAAEKISDIVARMVAIIGVAAVLLLVFFFSGMSLAFALSDWLENYWLGFLIVGLFYLIVSILLWVLRDRWVGLPVMNFLNKQLFNQNGKK